MVKYVFLYRHAQAEHNATSNWNLHDPVLTDLGRRQASSIPVTFSERFPDYRDQAHLVISSPMRRTIQTSLLGFPHRKELVFLPELQEVNNLPCDTGSSPARLSELYPHLDFSSLPHDWNSKQGPWSPVDNALAMRAKVGRRIIRSRPEEVAIVVTHGDFLRYYLAAGPDHSPEVHWENAEGRLYMFAGGEEDEDAWLVPVPPEPTAPNESVKARVEKGEEQAKTSREIVKEKTE